MQKQNHHFHEHVFITFEWAFCIYWVAASLVSNHVAQSAQNKTPAIFIISLLYGRVIWEVVIVSLPL